MSTENAEREQIRVVFLREGFRDIAEDMGRRDALWCILNTHRTDAPEFTGVDAAEQRARWQKGYDEQMKAFEERNNSHHNDETKSRGS